MAIIASRNAAGGNVGDTFGPYTLSYVIADTKYVWGRPASTSSERLYGIFSEGAGTPTLAAGVEIDMDTMDEGNLTVSGTGRVTLPANRRYYISFKCQLSGTTASVNDEAVFELYDHTGGAQINSAEFAARPQQWSTDNSGSGSGCQTIWTPSIDSDIGARCKSVVGTPDGNYMSLIVMEVPQFTKFRPGITSFATAAARDAALPAASTEAGTVCVVVDDGASNGVYILTGSNPGTTDAGNAWTQR